jgi:hypothetical protein
LTVGQIERIELTATLLNNLAVSSVALGGIGPMVAYISGITDRQLEARVVTVAALFHRSVVFCTASGVSF